MIRRHNSLRYFDSAQAKNRLRTGLVAHYLSGSSGLLQPDISGYQNFGTLAGGASWSIGREHQGIALELDGASGRSDAASVAYLDITAAVSLSAWVYLNAVLIDPAVIICKPAASGSHVSPFFAYCLATLASGSLRMQIATGGTLFQAAAPAGAATLRVWQHVAGTYDGVTIKLFINGVLTASTAQTGALNTFATPLRVGANGAPGEFWPGRLADIRTYNRALSDAEIFMLADPSFQAITPSTYRIGAGADVLGNPRFGDFFISGY